MIQLRCDALGPIGESTSVTGIRGGVFFVSPRSEHRLPSDNTLGLRLNVQKP